MARPAFERGAHQVGLHRRDDCWSVPRVHALDQSRRLAGLARAEEQHGTSHASSASERLALGHQHSPAPSTEDQPAGLRLSAEERREILRRRQPWLCVDANATTAVDRLVSALSVLQPQQKRPERSGEDDGDAEPVEHRAGEIRRCRFGPSATRVAPVLRQLPQRRERLSESRVQRPPPTDESGERGGEPVAAADDSEHDERSERHRLEGVGTVVARRVHGSSGGSR